MNEMFLELAVPLNGADLRKCVEDTLNEESFINADCHKCQQEVQKTMRKEIVDCDDAQFIIVILSRGIQSLNGYQFIKKQCTATNPISIR